MADKNKGSKNDAVGLFLTAMVGLFSGLQLMKHNFAGSDLFRTSASSHSYCQ
ncbi:hypothetical protein SK128_007644 [Halocaridina rubra]|uniref:Uncharacterized protein n=1 Tax=Halocaridina rubra TaxID=373956 RepID=A0AAN8WG72_HALRR